MNSVREHWRAGIPPNQANQFRQTITQAIHTVETACRQYQITPEDLPTPSRRAYQYLKGLDLNALPQRRKAKPARPQRVRVSGIIATCNDYHDRFAQHVADKPKRRWKAANVLDLADEIVEVTQDIEGLCEESGGTPGHLPVRSRRGYQWLTFLSDPKHLALHLNTLSTLTRIARELAPAGQTLEISLYATATLYRVTHEDKHIKLVINEGFIGAPAPILRPLIRVALDQNDEDAIAKIKHYGEGEPFEEILVTLALATAALTDDPQGQYHNLDAVYERVNAAYFQGKLDRPQLRWHQTPTRRKLAHYHRYNDTVVFHVTLDDPRVPGYVLDFVMYHELLHKHLGIKIADGRRRIHTPEFRALERQFEHYEKAQTFLDVYLQETAS